MPEETSYFLVKFCAFHLNYTFYAISKECTNVEEVKTIILKILETNIFAEKQSILYFELKPN